MSGPEPSRPNVVATAVPGEVVVALHVLDRSRLIEAPWVVLLPDGPEVYPGRDLECDEARARIAANERLRAYLSGEAYSSEMVRMSTAELQLARDEGDADGG